METTHALLVVGIAVLLTGLITWVVANELSNNNLDEEIKIVLVRLKEITKSISNGKSQ